MKEQILFSNPKHFALVITCKNGATFTLDEDGNGQIHGDANEIARSFWETMAERFKKLFIKPVTESDRLAPGVEWAIQFLLKTDDMWVPELRDEAKRQGINLKGDKNNDSR